MSDILPLAAQSILTDGSIRHHPDPSTSITPSTSADSKITIDTDDLDDLPDEHSDDGDVASISTSVVDSEGIVGRNTRERRQGLPPIPDMRFEQSYLAGIRPALEQEKYWLVVLLTIKDQVLFPLIQGCLWNLTLVGWRYWNRATKFSGASVGARIRRWWWVDVNGWKIPQK